MSNESVDATFYLQVEPIWSRWDAETVIGARLAGTTKNRPTKLVNGTVSVKLTVRLPKATFLPLRPEAVIEIPMELIRVAPVEVVAQGPAS